MVEVRQYRPCQSDDWDSLVDRSKNGTFLTKRRYMDYHSTRFEDHSIVVIADGRLQAALPANRNGSVLISHAGLTYGGLILDKDITCSRALLAFDACLNHARDAGFRQIVYKPSPHIYHTLPSEEDLYCLFRHQAELIASGLSSAIPIQRRAELSTIRTKQLALAKRKGVTVECSDAWDSAWLLLYDVLERRHNAGPTHSLDEILTLNSRFPDEIRLYSALHNRVHIAMVVVFDCGRTVHIQYIAASESGRKLGGVDAIIHHLLSDVFHDREWLDFGVSTEQGGRVINEGLLSHKESFGGKTVLYNQYQLSV